MNNIKSNSQQEECKKIFNNLFLNKNTDLNIAEKLNDTQSVNFGTWREWD